MRGTKLRINNRDNSTVALQLNAYPYAQTTMSVSRQLTQHAPTVWLVAHHQLSLSPFWSLPFIQASSAGIVSSSLNSGTSEMGIPNPFFLTKRARVVSQALLLLRMVQAVGGFGSYPLAISSLVRAESGALVELI
ncbi:hypothetical protein Acr_17g0010580 [Actinidia rufa]|uniref:Uncharacterized protein n=1 Tax=Actinidia rufa TaxID=165716 RepID=A0A7J0G3W8_9ERIC|nr:hypothetical protein Acr_17g0010580 [Actinidia rufa]